LNTGPKLAEKRSLKFEAAPSWTQAKLYWRVFGSTQQSWEQDLPLSTR